MDTIYTLLGLLATIISLYSTVCLVRIFLTWIPSLRYNRVTNFLAKICDPFLNRFSNIHWLRFGSMDFSPLLAFACLSIVSAILSSIARLHKFSLGIILQVALQLIWSLITSLLTIIIILLIIRLIFIFLKKDSATYWVTLDNFLYKISNKILQIFNKKSYVNIQTSVIITLIAAILIRVFGSFIINLLGNLLAKIPF